MWNWSKDNAGAITATTIRLGGFTGIIQFGIINPMHQRFDATAHHIDDLGTEMNTCFDA